MSTPTPPGEPTGSADDNETTTAAEREVVAPLTFPGLDRARIEPNQARSREKVARILDAATTLLVEMPSEEVTTHRIAAEAGLSAATVYRYFADKQAIIAALTQRDLESMGYLVLTTFPPDPETPLSEAMDAIFRAYITQYSANPAFVRLYLVERSAPDLHRFVRRFHRHLGSAIKALFVERGYIDPATPDEVGVLLIEMGDRIMQAAFSGEKIGEYDPRLIELGTQMLVDAVARYQVPRD